MDRGPRRRRRGRRRKDVKRGDRMVVGTGRLEERGMTTGLRLMTIVSGLALWLGGC